MCGRVRGVWRDMWEGEGRGRTVGGSKGPAAERGITYGGRPSSTGCIFQITYGYVASAPSPPPHSIPTLPASPSFLQEEMALAGYRTLCIAERELSTEQYNAWHEQYKAACVALVDREMALARVSERIEVDMTLLGATAVEDKLQVRRRGR